MYHLRIYIYVETYLHRRYAIPLANYLKTVVASKQVTYAFEQYLDIDYSRHEQQAGIWNITCFDDYEFKLIKANLECKKSINLFDSHKREDIKINLLEIRDVSSVKKRISKVPTNKDYLKLAIISPLYLKSRKRSDFVIYPTPEMLFGSIINKYEIMYKKKLPSSFFDEFVKSLIVDKYLLQTYPYYLDYKSDKNTICINALVGEIRFLVNGALLVKHKNELQDVIKLLNESQIGSKTRYGFGKVKLTFGESKKVK